jgi:hypothetical protein
MHYRTRGPLFSNALRRHKITVSAIDYGTLGGTNVPQHEIQFELLPGMPYADSNGVLYVILRDNLTNYVTPKLPASYSNYTYNISAERFVVPLTFNAAGELTARETTNSLGQLVGYKGISYDFATNQTETRVLGPGYESETGIFHQFQETRATVPLWSLGGVWSWHRDVQGKVFFWKTNAPSVVELVGTPKFFTPGPAGQGNGNDSSGVEADEIPDANGLIIVCDAPGYAPNALLSAVEAPPGSIYANRFYAREWVSWNGVRASDILRWRVFITLRRKADLTWERVAPDFVEETPVGDDETPALTPQQAQQASQQ